jgi:Flp pilus assembly protein TadG
MSSLIGRGMFRRSRQRGAAVIEMALGMTLFLPLTFLIVDYGYYFYVSITAVEAARVGARQLWNQPVTSCSNTTSVNATTSLVQGSSTGTPKTYMAQIGMSAYTTVTATCNGSPPANLSNPVWQLQVKIDFPLPMPTFGWGIPRSTTAGYALFTENLALQGK